MLKKFLLHKHKHKLPRKSTEESGTVLPKWLPPNGLLDIDIDFYLNRHKIMNLELVAATILDIRNIER